MPIPQFPAWAVKLLAAIAVIAVLVISYNHWRSAVYDEGYNARVAEEKAEDEAERQRIAGDFTGVSTNQQGVEDEHNRTKPIIAVLPEPECDRVREQPSVARGSGAATDPGQLESGEAARTEAAELGKALAADAESYPVCYALAHNLYAALMAERGLKTTVSPD